MKKVILFDFDGTIADSFQSFLSMLDIVAKKYGFAPIPPDAIPAMRNENARDLVKKLHVPFYKIPFMAHDFKQMQKKEIASIKPIPGISDVLQLLKEKGFQLGILTSNGRKNVEAFLEHNNLQLFDYLMADSGFLGKDKKMRKFLDLYGLVCDEVMYVGDEIRDIQASRNVGLAVVSVTWGFNSRDGLTKFNPDYLIDSPQDLVSIVSQ